MKTEMTLEQKLELARDVVAKHDHKINEGFLTDLIKFVESGFDTTKILPSDQVKSNLFASKLSSLRGMSLSIEEMFVNGLDEGIVFEVTGPIPGTNTLATVNTGSDLLSRYLALALQDGFLDAVSVKFHGSDFYLTIATNGEGNIMLNVPLSIEPNFMKGLILNVFVNLEAAKEKSEMKSEMKAEDESEDSAISRLQRQFPGIKVVAVRFPQ